MSINLMDLIQMAMGECSANSSLQVNSKAKFGLQVGGHLALTDFHSEDPSELLHMAPAVDDSTINIVLGIIIIIIITL